ncbi:MAG: serine hydrolase domain-containing protein [Chloroflexota bacterium]
MNTDFINDHPDLRTSITLFDKWLIMNQHTKQLPSVAVGLVHNGDLLWGKGYGYADLANKTPMTLDTRFRIASITKTFTALAILQLVEQGQLRLDDPIGDYVTWFNLQYADAPPITIYHCLTHTSGLPRDATIPHWTENVFQDVDEFRETTQTRYPTMPPLMAHSYSNLGYSLLGEVIETVTGKTWEDAIQNILNQLGMTDTVVKPQGHEDRLAIGYLTYDDNYEREAVSFIETKAFSPSASMASTVNDLVKYAKFHLSKGLTPLISGYYLREMHRVHWVNEDWSGGYGLGTRTWRMGDYVVSGHTGGYKGFLTMFSVCREHDFGVIVLTNSLDSTPYQVAEKAYTLVLPEITKITAKTRTPDPIWQDYVGSYKYDWGDGEVVIRNGQLQVLDLKYLNAPPIILEPTDADTFIIRVPGNPGETAKFIRDDSGKVVRMQLRNEYSIKVD